MKLLIVRNPDSPLLDCAGLDGDDRKIVLIQNGAYSGQLLAKGAAVLECDAKARNITVPADKKINYDGLLDAIFEADGVFVI